jgi:carbamoyl-phosphate synthase large subunit
VSEHIEDAGVHSGDATLVLPPQTLYIRTIRDIRRIAAAIARELKITGPFNMQFLAKLGAVKVIECNLRASRSFPFVSKVTGTNFAAEATSRMLGLKHEVSNETLALDYVGVKVPMFSFSRIVGADPMLGVEMTSTGEVGCLGADLDEALLHGLLATGFRFPSAGVLVSLGPIADKYGFADETRLIVEELGLPVYATKGTAERLVEVGVDCIAVEKEPGEGTSAFDVIDDGRVDLVINIPREYDEQGRPDGYLIRRRAVDAGIPLITDLKLAGAIVEALRSKRPHELGVVAWGDYIKRGPVPLR